MFENKHTKLCKVPSSSPGLHFAAQSESNGTVVTQTRQSSLALQKFHPANLGGALAATAADSNFNINTPDRVTSCYLILLPCQAGKTTWVKQNVPAQSACNAKDTPRVIFMINGTNTDMSGLARTVSSCLTHLM
jgi:hypothetical protein